MLPAASFRAAAQAVESFGCLPLAACVDFVLACLRRVLAFWRTLRAFLPGVVAAWSISFSAVVSFPVTLPGMV